MATSRPFAVPMGDDTGDVATQQAPWPKRVRLSSVGDAIDSFLAKSGFERGPWLVVAFACGIWGWFLIDSSLGWLCFVVALLAITLLALGFWGTNHHRDNLRLAVVTLAIAAIAGMGTIWMRSALVGTPAIAGVFSGTIYGRVLEREERPAERRVRLVLATRLPGVERAVKIRVNLPEEKDISGLREGAVARFSVRLMPPASPMLPGGYDFARSAWFEGLAATGSAYGDVRLLETAASENTIAEAQRQLADHVRSRLSGSPGSIAAAFASGDRGAISRADEDAMRDAGLTHLLSISGLHVSAVIAASYFLAMRLLGLWQWLALRVRVPLVAASVSALAGVGYTLLTGAEVPTVRSCLAALLVLLALALGREPLSLRPVSIAALIVMIVLPESVITPGFQMSFSAVIAIVALHACGPVRKFLAPCDEGWVMSASRRALMLFVTGLVIELALMPIVVFHFHKAGAYGAFANVIAIPLTTFVTMPLIALSLIFDAIGLGGPLWWLTGKSLELLLALAHWTAALPGSVRMIPVITIPMMALFCAGAIWLALWRGSVRLLGLAPVAIGLAWIAATDAPDLLVSGDGKHVGIVVNEGQLVMLRDTRSDYTIDNFSELSGVAAKPMAMHQWENARCSRDFCAVSIERNGRYWHMLVARSRSRVPLGELAAACAKSDIVIAERRLPSSCRPRWLKADREMLSRSGGLAISLTSRRITSVSESQGRHGWWRGDRF